jgi:hypothetical protein
MGLDLSAAKKLQCDCSCSNFASGQEGASMPKDDTKTGFSPSQLITNQFEGLGDWRGRLLIQLRRLIHEADPEITEEWKWDSAVWTHKGLLCSAGPFKDHVKLNFFKGASLKDPHGLFNAGLEAKATRAIDFSEGSSIDEPALKELIRAAVAFNLSVGIKK